MADLQWEQFTLGQNKVIQDIASAASKASAIALKYYSQGVCRQRNEDRELYLARDTFGL